MNIFRAFMELDEAYNNRQSLIDDIKKSGKSYNFDKYSDTQLYRIWQRLQASKPVTQKLAIEKPIVKEPAHELDLEFENKYDNYCDCGMRLSDAGFCPVCDDGEEDLYEGIFDSKPGNLSSWITASGQPVRLPGLSARAPSNNTQSSPTASTTAQTTGSKYIVRIVSHGGRLRALATDGVHPAAWVSFPNDLRQFDGQKYEVDQLIWNGKNYRVAGNIVEI